MHIVTCHWPEAACLQTDRRQLLMTFTETECGA